MNNDTRRMPSVMVAAAPASEAQATTTLVVAESTALVVSPFKTGTITISEDQIVQAEAMLKPLEVQNMPGQAIVSFGAEAEVAFNTTLNGFLARLDKNTAAAAFALFDRLKKNVDDAKLDKIIVDVQSVKPGFFDRCIGMLRGQSRSELQASALEKVRNLLSGKTTSLATSMNDIEKQLGQEIKKLLAELQALDHLKDTYGIQFGQLALVAAVAQAYVAKAQQYVDGRKVELKDDQSVRAQTEISDLEVKLQLLKSRALALEGLYTRLPGDQEVIRQIESAGISTLGETMTTANSRFASIKMTLLATHGALQVKSVQNATAALATLDENLLRARGKLVKEVAVSAANAPGDNRLAQSEQIARIVTETRELYQAVDAARKDNEVKFATARERFAKARADLQQISASNPQLELAAAPVK